MKVKKILLPVDGSEHSKKATRYAIDFAKQMDAEVVLIHSYTLPVMLEGGYVDNMTDAIFAAANEMIEDYRGMLRKEGIRFKDKVLEGPPPEVIVDVAKSEKCDMIIMGSRGRGELKGLLLGSVTHRVLYTAPCPVLVLR